MNGLSVNPAGARGASLRHGLETRYHRPLGRDQPVQHEAYALSDEKIELGEPHCANFRCLQVEASRPGELPNQGLWYRGAIFTDNGRTDCDQSERDPYARRVPLAGIEYRPTRAPSPRSDGFVERKTRTLLDECVRVGAKETWYLTPEEIQRDLARLLSCCGLQRSRAS